MVSFGRKVRILFMCGLLKKYERLYFTRHTAATLLLENGCDLKTCSEILGHSNTKVTANVYVHPNLEMKKKAMAKMEDVFKPKSE